MKRMHMTQPQGLAADELARTGGRARSAVANAASARHITAIDSMETPKSSIQPKISGESALVVKLTAVVTDRIAPR